MPDFDGGKHEKILSMIAMLFVSAGACFAENNQDVAEGRDIWFKSTFGGERFFSLVLPNPPSTSGSVLIKC